MDKIITKICRLCGERTDQIRLMRCPKIIKETAGRKFRCGGSLEVEKVEKVEKVWG